MGSPANLLPRPRPPLVGPPSPNAPPGLEPWALIGLADLVRGATVGSRGYEDSWAAKGAELAMALPFGVGSLKALSALVKGEKAAASAKAVRLRRPVPRLTDRQIEAQLGREATEELRQAMDDDLAGVSDAMRSTGGRARSVGNLAKWIHTPEAEAISDSQVWQDLLARARAVMP